MSESTPTSGDQVLETHAPVPPAGTAAANFPGLARPWPRYWAKMFDITVLSVVVLWGVVLFAPVRALAALPTNEMVLGLLAMPIAVVLESLLYAAAGNTLGKWILGVRVLGIDQKPLPLHAALARNVRCWVFGLGCGIPLVSLFTLANAHSKAKRGEAQSWELATSSRCYSFGSSGTRTWIGALLSIAVIFGVRFLSAYQETPKGALEVTALAVNARAPMQIDPETRLDGAVAGTGRLQYLYTLTKYEPSAPGAAGELARHRPDLYVSIHKQTCTGSAFDELRRTGVTFQHTYRDRLGNTAFDFVIPPSDCNTDGSMLAMAAEVNAFAPKVVDEVTRLDGAAAVGTTFRYLYTLTTDLSVVPISTIAELRSELAAGNARRVCAADEFRWLRAKGGTVEFVYRDTNGATVLEVVARTTDCAAQK
jgi:uncharacterized RDD family membrane protein YckC